LASEAGMVPDAGVPDSAVPDAVAPDIAVPDGSTPDLAVPDTATPDGPTPDLVAPDTATPDALVLPDLPDFLAPTQDTVAVTSDAAGSSCLKVAKVGNQIVTSQGGFAWYQQAVFFHQVPGVQAGNVAVTGVCGSTECTFGIPSDVVTTYWDTTTNSWQPVTVRYGFVQFFIFPFELFPLPIPSCKMDLVGTNMCQDGAGKHCFAWYGCSWMTKVY